MPNNYDAIDIKFLWNGDYEVAFDGDFEDTASDQIQSLVQEVQTICNSEINDWQENPKYAATLDDFIGEPNNRNTARKISDRIKTSLVSNNVVKSSDLSINTIPVDRYRLFIIITISAAPTSNNSVLQNGQVTVSMVYDYSEQGISFVDISDS
jgi:hypothetical protein